MVSRNEVGSHTDLIQSTLVGEDGNMSVVACASCWRGRGQSVMKSRGRSSRGGLRVMQKLTRHDERVRMVELEN